MKDISEEEEEEKNENEAKEKDGPSIEKALEEVRMTKEGVSLLKEKFKKLEEKAGRSHYECARLEIALDGVYWNLAPLSGKGKIEDYKRVYSIWGTCVSLRHSIDRESEDLRKLEEQAGGWTTVETAAPSGSAILADSTAAYEVNAPILHLPITPPSRDHGLDPYVEDQPEVEKELFELLRGIDLGTKYSDVKKMLESTDPAKLSAAASEMRTLIWEIYRRLAPHERVICASGFRQLHEKGGKATYKQRVAYILTGNADIEGAQGAMIEQLYRSLKSALGDFSARIKTVNRISDYQLRKRIAQSERVLLTLLKNRKT